ncbi:MAG: PAS domain-containing protein, partial [Thermodesulfobacteriota bacterium]
MKPKARSTRSVPANRTGAVREQFCRFLIHTSLQVLESAPEKTDEAVNRLLKNCADILGVRAVSAHLFMNRWQTEHCSVTSIYHKKLPAGRQTKIPKTAAELYRQLSQRRTMTADLRRELSAYVFFKNDDDFLPVRFSAGSSTAGFLLCEPSPDLPSADKQLAQLGRIIYSAMSKKRESQRQERERLMIDTIMEHQLDRVYIKDARARFVKVNNALVRYHNFTRPEDTAGKTDYDLFTREHAEQAYRIDRRIIKTGKPSVNLLEKETMPDGEIRWSTTTKVPLRAKNGKVIGL